MSWRDNLQPASFRGVPFEVDSSGGQFGRRLVVHEFPQRDEPFVEDLGRSVRRRKLQAFVLGNDYRAKKERLLAALEEYGPGMLVHPLDGQLSVQVEQVSTSESTAEGGCCRFDISFVEAGEQRYPSASVDTSARVASSADTLGRAGQADFLRRFDLRGADFLQPAAQGRLDGVLDGLGRLGSLLDGPPGAGFQRSLRTTPGLMTARDNGGFASRLSGLFQALRPVPAAQRLQAYRGFSSYGLADPLGVPINTPSRRQAAANDASLSSLVRSFALGEAALAGRDMQFQTVDDAMSWRGELGDMVDGEAERTSDDARFLALEDLRRESQRDIAERSVALPRLRQVSPAGSLPAPVLAYRLFGPDHVEAVSAEAGRRNGVAHPGFLPARPLLILTPPGFTG
jgi:prophage DNA circulation protein